MSRLPFEHQKIPWRHGVMLYAIVLLLAACQTTGAETAGVVEKPPANPSPRAFVPHELLIKFKPTVSTERIETILADAKVELIAKHIGTGIYHVRIHGNESVESVSKKLSSQPEVEYAEPNLLYQQSR